MDCHIAKTFLSKADDDLRLSTPSEEGRSDCWKEFDIDCYIVDGDRIDCGDKSIEVIATPGHTAGCMSFIFPVCENGGKHIQLSSSSAGVLLIVIPCLQTPFGANTAYELV